MVRRNKADLGKSVTTISHLVCWVRRAEDMWFSATVLPSIEEEIF